MYSSGVFSILSRKVSGLLENYLDKVQKGEMKTCEPLTPTQLSVLMLENTQEKGIEKLCSMFIDYSLHLHSPNNFGHQVGVPTVYSMLGSFIESVLNSSTAVYETSTVGNVVDQLVIKKLLEKYSMPMGGGFFTSGGSLGNLTGLLAARENLKMKYGKKYDHKKVCILVPEYSHYSLEKAMHILGYNNTAIIPIKTNDNQTIKINDLRSTVKSLIKKGHQILAVCVNAGNTVLGAYDDIYESALIAREEDIWFHVDGCHGGAAIFSEKYKHYIKGVEFANSFVLDFHKMLGINAAATAVLFKSYKDSYKGFYVDSSYLFDQENDISYDLGKRTIECTKPSRAMSVYIQRQMCGDEGFQYIVDVLFDLSQLIACDIDNRNNFELYTLPMANILCFRYTGNNNFSVEVLNKINEQIRKDLMDDGTYYVVKVLISGSYWLRVTINNPLSKIENFKGLLDMIENIGVLYVSSITH